MVEIGDKVICINDAKQPHTVEELNKDVPNWIKRGKEYTIRAIIDSDFVVGVLLEEVINSPVYFKVVNKVQEPSFLISRFRKREESSVAVEEEIEKLINT